MTRRCAGLIYHAAVVALLWNVWLHGALAADPAPAAEQPPDPAACVAAAAAGDDDRIIAVCAALIDNDKTAPADRIKALIARAAAYRRKDMADAAIGDYTAVLRLDPTLVDIYNARGELWRNKGNRPDAVRDFGAALKLDPDNAVARSNYRSLAQELERIGAQMALSGKPSFDCAAARRPVEKAICASPALADLDREINAANARAVRTAARDNPRAARALQHEQDDFIVHRDAGFGRPDYDLEKAMRERLDHLQALEQQ
ncbi:MAG TPA: tetratricopeptide repeat protein [Bradyrhizobium sp.]|nr:tetratricopeptide repeat protein [Bradyrhizobium sp.]